MVGCAEMLKAAVRKTVTHRVNTGSSNLPPTTINGQVAQLVEHLVEAEGVGDSISPLSTRIMVSWRNWQPRSTQNAMVERP